MNSFIKKIFSTLAQKPWETDQAIIDTKHSGQTFTNLSNQMSAVIIIFGIIVFITDTTIGTTVIGILACCASVIVN